MIHYTDLPALAKCVLVAGVMDIDAKVYIDWGQVWPTKIFRRVEGERDYNHPWRPDIDPAAAWEVLEWWCAQGPTEDRLRQLAQRWLVMWAERRGDSEQPPIAETLMHAVIEDGLSKGKITQADVEALSNAG